MQWIYIIVVFVPVHAYYFNNSIESVENSLGTPCTDQNHFFLAPGVLTAGGTNRACVSRFYPEGSARMLLSLIAEDKQTASASRDLPPGDGGCLDISVPLLPNTKADLVVNIWYPEAKCSWERRVTLRISSGRVVVVHTERARYRPGETLRARVFALKAELIPSPGNVEEIWIEGPPGAWEGSRVAQWSNVRSKMGLAQVQHDIDELAPPGRWTVRARLGDGSQGSAVFWVGNYELPPFQLTVRHAPRVLRTSDRLAWTVCVRYPWTEAVEGMLVIRLRGAGSDSPGIRTAVRLRAPRACHRHAAAARRVGLGGERAPHVVVADFSFQEDGTRVWQNTTVVSQVVDKPIELEFITKRHHVISPALPYKLKVKATRWDDKPASSEKVLMCRYSIQNDKQTNTPTCMSADTDSSGVARVIFADEDDGSPYYRFEASLFNDSSTTSGPLTLATRRSPIQAVLGPLRAEAKGTRTFVPLYLSLQNVTAPVTVHFVVITRGGIIYRWGATTQCPIASSATHIQTAARNTKCDDPMEQYNDDKNQKDKDQDTNNTNKRENNKDKNTKSNRSYDININLYSNQNQNINFHYPNKTRNMNQNDKDSYLHRHDKNELKHTIYDKFTPIVIAPNVYVKADNVKSIQHEVNASDALLDRNLLRIMLPIKVTQQMCPDSHLIAYFYYNGEFVSASKHFEMDDCFVNKVEAGFLSRSALPGSLTTLQVWSPGPALCALTAVDSAAKWGHNYAVRDVLIAGLRRMIQGHRNVTEYDAAGDCFLSAETPPLPTNSLELTASWLASAGVRTVADTPIRRTCDEPAYLLDEGTVPRSDFSEAWLCRLVTVGSNGSAVTTAQAPDSITRYEANAICLSKTGVGVSRPAVLQVFREFFIHADSPKRLRRGDSTIIRYRLFNYLYEPLSVQIQILTELGITGPSNIVESVCIQPRASTARRASVTAEMAGDGRVIIRAKAVNDGGCGSHVTYGKSVSDEVVIKIAVEPEGVPVQEHKSMLLCGKDNSNSTSSQVSWNFGHATMIPGTESLTVWAAGDIVGPLLADADSLVLFPRGCGEQNMARLATNLLALSHLHPHSATALAAKEHVARGFTRQLQYLHPSGGFSAFGPSDVTSSTWLTAFSLRYLRRAHKILYPKQQFPPAIERAEGWLLNQQMENGCFRNEGQVFHRELRGGLNEEGEIASVALTAYVITSLLESTTPLPSRLLRNTLSCLRALPPLKYSPPGRVYAHSLLAYGFVRMKKYEEDLRRSNEAKLETEHQFTDQPSWLQRSGLKEHEGLLEVMELMKMATREGEFLWWETGSLSTSIEATSYALLALRESPSALREFGSDAVRWLAAHRGPTGGFVSTQDTLVGLEALTAWSSLQPSPSNLSVSARSGPVSIVAKLDPALRIPEVLKMGTGDQITIGVEGSGCALVQATRSYHAPSSARCQHQLSVELSLHTDGTFDCDAAGENCLCAAICEVCVVWSGSFPTMALLEVSLPGGYGADASRLYSQLHEPHSLLRRIELTPTSSRATLYLAALDDSETTPRHGHECFNIHAVGPQAKTRPAYVRIMDYYTPSINDTQIYTIPEECPSRISHDLNQDITSDNLYNKARSMSDKGEILITHEFTFDDIPEGIPLEDPLYDNLTREDKNKSDFRRNVTEFNNIRNYNKINNNASNIEIDSMTNYNSMLNHKAYSNNVRLNENFNNNIKVNEYDKTNESNNIQNNGTLNKYPKDMIKINIDGKIDYNIDLENKIKANEYAESVKIDDGTRINKNLNDKIFRLQNNNNENTNSYVDPNAIFSPPYRNPYPYIPSDIEEATPIKNVMFDVSKIIASNSYRHINFKIDDKLEHVKENFNKPRNNVIIPKKSNEIGKVTFNSGEKQLDVNNENDDKNYEETSTQNNLVEPTTHIYNEKQRSIAPNTTTTIEIKNTNNISNSDNENKLLNHRIEIRDEHKDSQEVDNPKLSDFHVIDSDKDLEVPSGVEGPVPSIVLPPVNFVPPPISSPDHFTKTNIPSHFDPRHSQSNNFISRNGELNMAAQNFVTDLVPPNDFVIQNPAPAIFVSQNEPPQNGLSQIAPQTISPNNFAQIPVHNFIPRDSPPSYSIDPQHFAPTSFALQKPATNIYTPRYSVPKTSNFATQHFVPNNLDRQSFVAPHNFRLPYDMSPPSRDMVPPPLKDKARSNAHSSIHSDPNSMLNWEMQNHFKSRSVG